MKKSKELRYRKHCIKLVKKTNPEIDFEAESGFTVEYRPDSPFVTATFNALFLNKLSPEVLEQFLTLPYRV